MRAKKYTEVCSIRGCEHAPLITGRLRLCEMHKERIIDLLDVRPFVREAAVRAQEAEMRKAPNGDRLIALVGGLL